MMPTHPTWNSILSSKLTWLLVWSLQSIAWSHPFHISSAEMEFNAQTRRFEVSLRVQISDLELALSRSAQNAVALEKTPDIDKKIVTYLEQNFYLSGDAAPPDAAGRRTKESSEQRSKIVWVGKEVEGLWGWLYFELIPPPAMDVQRLTNKVFLDSVDEQLNTCLLRCQSHRESLTFDATRPHVTMPKIFNGLSK